ncbi:bacillithiol biosynthesis cysteine-adding enzyme BshC [Bacillus sp. AFS041924]|uniref:bacillithiol biosynthesis cysteine-adding enzyme BshC n=1 Tax=Bacillus sp. AFS041924 TaxID=2033503 RepID=UPI000BFCC710|nr:bacillithiol biosynthesis cysteine-adding enzyme BshC [Bacillus sp. AFS041924]PGS48576.1 bacillithiol biosynthesis cysteine-adding enzyme BshC [Bacillus sp. AFS041924]
MQISKVHLVGQNKLLNDFVNGKEVISSFFGENPLVKEEMEYRIKNVMERSYNRTGLVNALEKFHQKHKASNASFENVKKLLNEDSFVVIGGQQAGLLTGPLYSIHKIISIIQLAKKYEKEHSLTVVPVFWIAGEDHDIDEINHIHTIENKAIKKQTYYQKSTYSNAASRTEIDKMEMRKWIDKIVTTFDETNYSRELLGELYSIIEQSTTYVDFFAKIIFKLFKNEGLVLIDADDPNVRELESSLFNEMIQKQQIVRSVLKDTKSRLTKAGYHETLQIAEQSIHLFYHSNEGRQLLEVAENEEVFQTKNKNYQFSKTELIEIANDQPALLSNNVVTRPIMQEYLFPTLAFVGGPGEVAYWAELKDIFTVFNLQMPPVFLRHMFTIFERNIVSALEDFSLDINDALNSSIEEKKVEWIKDQVQLDYKEVFGHAKKSLEELHKPLQDVTNKVTPNLKDFSKKNYIKIEEQILLLERKIEESILKQHEEQIEKWDRIICSISPNGKPQERVLNIFYYINKYGFDFVHELCSLEVSWDHAHQIVKI